MTLPPWRGARAETAYAAAAQKGTLGGNGNAPKVLGITYTLPASRKEKAGLPAKPHMEYFNSTKWKLYADLSSSTRAKIANKIYTRANEREILSMLSRHDCPEEIVELAATHTKCTLRRAAALNSNVSEATLTELTRDTSRTVADTATVVQLLALAREPENNPTVAYTPALAKAVASVLANEHVPEHKLTRLLSWLARDPEWLADKKLMAAAWDSDVPMFEALVPSVGLEGALGAILTGARTGGKWLAVEIALDLAETPRAAYEILRASSVQLQTLLNASELFASSRDKRSRRRNTQGQAVKMTQLSKQPEEVQCAYLAMDNCPEETLKEAALNGDDIPRIASVIAALNGARKPEFRAWLLAEIIQIWEFEGYGFWEAAQALEDEELLDLPVAMLEDYDYEDTGTMERALAAFKAQIEDTLDARPEAWETYTTLEVGYEGTLRELAAAVRGL